MELNSLTEFLVRELLPGVDNIEIKGNDVDGVYVIQILVPNEYMSKIIGKAGNIANSIRTIIQAAAYNKKLGKVRINIDSI